MLRGLRHGYTGFAQVLAVLAFIAIAVRAFVPAGYMVGSVGPSQQVAIYLCSGHEAVLDLSKGQTPQRQDGSDQNAPCVFAAAAHFATPVAFFETPAPLARESTAHYQVAAIAPGRGLAAPPPWATGPPLSA